MTVFPEKLITENQIVDILARAPNAILVVNEENKIVFLSNQAEIMFGYARNELIGKSYEILIPERYRKKHSGSCKNYLKEPLIISMGHEQKGVICVRKDGSEFNAEIDLNSLRLIEKLGAQYLVISVIRDITERKKARDIIHLLLEIYTSISQTKTFLEALQTTITLVCETTGWDYGEAWVLNSGGKKMKSSPARFSTSTPLNKFREASSKLTFLPGEGLPGRVWISKNYEWIRDVSAESEKIYFRAKLALEMGLKACIGIPIVADHKVLAVLVFYMFESRAEDEHLVDIISAVAAQLGSIVQLKKTEEAIRASELRFRSVAETATDTIAIIDKNSKILFINDAVERIFGHSKDELIGESLTKLMPERYRQKHLEAVARYLKTRVRHLSWRSIELTGLHKTGAEIPLEISYSEFIIDKQHFFNGIIRDITKRKIEEQELIDEKNFSDEVINSMPGIFYIFDVAGGKAVRWNKNAEMDTGFTEEEIYKINPLDICATEDREKIVHHLEEVMTNGKASTEACFVTKSGEAIPYFFTSVRIVKDSKHYIMGEAIDISERVQAENALKEKDKAIRKVYVDVFSAVTGGKLIIMAPDEIRAILGEPITGRYTIKAKKGLAGARAIVRKAIESELAKKDEIASAVIAFSEASTNAIKHAGRGEFQLYRTKSTVQILVADNGPGIDFSILPKATLVSGYSTTQTLGMGFTCMLEFCDRVLLSTQPSNTTIVLESKVD